MFDLTITPKILLWVGLLFAFKHFVADGPLQREYQYKNKGNLGHPGGYLHAGIHGVATAIIMFPFGLWWLGAIEAVVHFVIDWGKVNLTAKYGWSGVFEDPTTKRKCLQVYSDFYFWALMADQCLHFATYLVLLYILAT